MAEPTKTMTSLGDLIERIREAKGPDRELDGRIWAEVDGRDLRIHDDMLLARRRVVPHDECVVGYYNDPPYTRFATAGQKPPIPRYTESLDAAFKLAPDGYDWIIARTNGGLTIHACVGSTKEHFGETPALSLCLAAMIARRDNA